MWRIAHIWCALSVPILSAQTGAPAAASLTRQYCVGCHSAKAKIGGVVVEGIDWTDPGANSATLEKVLRKVRSGEMPPAGLPHPAKPAADAFSNWLESELDRAATAHPNPGRPAIHRLNRAEYGNAVRDLLGIHLDVSQMLPVDDSGYGFDNVADVLSVSPALLERYMATARVVSRRAVGDMTLKPVEEEYETRRPGSRGFRPERVSDYVPFASLGGIAVDHYFPLDAEYLIRVKLPGGENPPPPQEVRLPIRAGLHNIGAVFLRDSAKPEIAMLGGRGAPVPGPPPRGKLDIRIDGVRVKLVDVGAQRVDKLIIGGPYNPTGRGDTGSRAKIFTCKPSTAAEEEPCARTILANLARRAFRRPVGDPEVKPLLAFYKSGRAEGDFDRGIEKALRAMLVSPSFLFRVERDPAGAGPRTVYRISDYELASRLSFFLWSSIPDDELLDLAGKGKLKDAATLQGQVRRMLDDPRSEALVQNFAGQWLYLRNLETSKPDSEIFTDYDENLRDAFRKETELFFGHILREDRSVVELLDANYTFLNQRLAEHYGIPNVYGSQFRKVTLDDPRRGGLLGQGSVLTVTSYPNRTSVVQRGKWILETLLGAPPPPPPPDVPDLKPKTDDGRELSLREALEIHRSNAVCASCHSRMDPLGFALENYDGVGKWRTKDSGHLIDSSAKMPDGTKFEGLAGLKKVLLSGHRDDFVGSAAEKLLIYALGRGLESYDMPAVRVIVRDAAKDNYRMSALIGAVVRSTPFQMRRTSDQ
jgi:mono/diheme cytochrome c family protein